VFKRIGAIVLSLALAALVLVPLVIDQPFGAQTPGSLALAFHLRRWSPVVTLVAGVLLAVVAVRAWRDWRGLAGRATLVVAVVISGAALWLSRQNVFERMFNPLPRPEYARVDAATFLEGRDLVLAVHAGNDDAAYPIRQLAYHHLVNDTIGGVPAVVTY
jgi:hypothetical protein